MLNSSGNMPRKRYVGLAKPKPKKRSKPIPTLRSHGRKLRCRASTFLASTIVRQRPGLCKARLSWRSLEGYCACRRHQRCHWRKRGLRYVADFWAALGQATACSYVSMWGAERKAQWRIEEWRAQIDPMRWGQVQILLPKRISRRRLREVGAGAPASLSGILAAASFVLYSVIRSDVGHSADLLLRRYKTPADLNVLGVNWHDQSSFLQSSSASRFTAGASGFLN
jgi:hypothetical protein